MPDLRLLLATIALAATAPNAPAYRLTASVPVGGPDRWDYLADDPETGRVYLAHGDRLTVLGGRAGRVVGEIAGIAGGTHGTVISAATRQGFTDDGKAGEVVVFDPATLAVTHHIPARPDADGIALDRATGLVFVVEGDGGTVTVVDPRTDTATATLPVGEKLEFPVADDVGHVFIAGEEKGDIVEIDARRRAVVAHWFAPGCTSPHGLAIDTHRHRLFMGCANAVLAVVDATRGRMIASVPIGRGNDAVAFDPVRARVFSSNGRDGTISVYQEGAGDTLTRLPDIATAVSGRTMTIDPRSGRLFVAAAETDPDPAGGRPKVRAGTLRLMIFDPVVPASRPSGDH